MLDISTVLLTGVAYIYTGICITILMVLTTNVDVIIKSIVPKKYLPEHDKDIEVNLTRVVAIISTWPVWLTLLILISIGKVIYYIYKKIRKK